MPTHPDTPHYHPLVRAVARALRKRCKVGPGASIVVACSGGADSVALLRALAMLAGRRKWQLHLIVGHVQHHLRGDDAERDAAMVGLLAAQLGLCYERRDIHPADTPGNLEANARRQRYAALADIAIKRGARFIATAHHADDQLETVLMRLVRGTSPMGLRGIAARRRLRNPESTDDTHRLYVIRPMIEAEHDQAIDLLHLLDQPWREDATNTDTTRTRAMMRHKLIPLLKQIRADAAGKAVALTDQLDDVHRLIKEQANDVAAQIEPLDALPRNQARMMNPMVLTQVLRQDLINAGVPRDRLPGHALKPVIDAIKDQAGGTRRFAFASSVAIEVCAEMVKVMKGAVASED